MNEAHNTLNEANTIISGKTWINRLTQGVRSIVEDAIIIADYPI